MLPELGNRAVLTVTRSDITRASPPILDVSSIAQLVRLLRLLPGLNAIFGASTSCHALGVEV